MDVGVGELLTSDHFHLDVGERVLEVGEEVVHARVLGLRGRFPREAPLGSHGRMVFVPCCAGLRRTQTDLTSRSPTPVRRDGMIEVLQGFPDQVVA